MSGPGVSCWGIPISHCITFVQKCQNSKENPKFISSWENAPFNRPDRTVKLKIELCPDLILRGSIQKDTYIHCGMLIATPSGMLICTLWNWIFGCELELCVSQGPTCKVVPRLLLVYDITSLHIIEKRTRPWRKCSKWIHD